MRIAESADGKGRTLWQILTGQNAKKEIANPLQLNNGHVLNISNKLIYPEFLDINFAVYTRQEVEYIFNLTQQKEIQIVYILFAKDLTYYLQSSLSGDFITLFSVFDKLEFDSEFNEIVEEFDEFSIDEDKSGNKLDWVYKKIPNGEKRITIGDQKFLEYIYERETLTGTEYLKIEKNTETGMFAILIGKQINKTDIYGY